MEKTPSTSIVPIGTIRPSITRKQSSLHGVFNSQIERHRLLASKTISSQGNLASIVDSGIGMSVSGPSAIESWLATTVTEGPNKEEEPTGNNYWIKRLGVLTKDNDPNSKLELRILDEKNPLFRHLIVTNLSEGNENTHFLPEHSIIHIHSIYDLSDPAPIKKYWTLAGFPKRVACVIKSAEGFNGNFVEVQNVRLDKTKLPDVVEWQTYGEVYTVLIAPGFRTRHFQPLITPANIITTTSTVQWKMLDQNGIWSIEAKTKRGTRTLNINVPLELSDCSTVDP